MKTRRTFLSMLKNWMYPGLFLFSFFLFFSQNGWSGTEGSITGTVVDPQGIAAAKVKVKLLSLDGKVLKEVETSETGDYQFFPVTFGKYRVSVGSSSVT